MRIVTHQDLIIFNFSPDCPAVKMLRTDIGKKMNTKRITIVKHDFASFISFRFFFFVVDSSPAIAFGGFWKEREFLAARKF
jgi:hypothetical protein